MEEAPYQRNIIIATKLFKQLAHGRALNVKAADGISPADLMGHPCVLLEFLDIVNIYGNAPILENPGKLPPCFRCKQVPAVHS